MANILIVEDEFITAKSLSDFVELSGYNVIGSALTIDEAIDYLKEEKIDLVLLDINLNEDRDGIWLANYINNNYQIPFVFLTAFGDKVTLSEALKTSPFSFLTKPFQEIELFGAITIALEKYNTLNKNREEGYLFLKRVDVFERVKISDIIYFESDKNYLKVYTDRAVYSYRTTIKDCIKELNRYFIQVHRAFIVNLNKVMSLDKTERELRMSNNTVPVSRPFYRELLNKLESK